MKAREIAQMMTWSLCRKIVLLQLVLGTLILLGGCAPEIQSASDERELTPDALSPTPTSDNSVRDTAVPSSPAAEPSTPNKPATPVSSSGDSHESQEEDSAVIDDPGKSAALADDLLIRFQRSGGFAGIDQKWLIYADGRVIGPEGELAVVDIKEINRLLETIISAGFLEMDDSYVPLNSCCDRFSYAITVQHDGIAKTVQTIDAAPKQPAQLIEMIDAISALLATVD